MDTTTDLGDLRRNLDRIDDQLHALLMQRTFIVEEVARRKANGNLPALHPEREAEILRRLARNHAGGFPLPALLRIWREIVSATIPLQRPDFAIAVHVPDESRGSGYWDLARDHFGSYTPMLPYPSATQVIQAVTDRRATAGILPVPQEGEAAPWWPTILSDLAPKVIARLPFGDRGNLRHDPGDAFAVGYTDFRPTGGGDRSLIVAELVAEASRARLFAAIEEAGFSCTGFVSFQENGATRVMLFEIGDHLADGDPRLATLAERLGAAVGRLIPLGGYAVPFGLGAQFKSEAVPS